jgi:cholest-4-en-3-one 26-monooxygenase
MAATAPRPDARERELDLTYGELFIRDGAHEVWRRLRAENPVSWQEGRLWFPGFWSITKHADILAISRDPHTFISSKGISMAADPTPPPEERESTPSMITVDPPRHVRLRRLVNKGFTPRMVGLMEPGIRDITLRVIDKVAARGECDFVTEVAAQLPLAVICTMLGAPEEDWPLLFSLTNQVLGPDDPEYQTEGRDRRETARHGARQMFAYYAKTVADRRREPQEDLVTLLTQAEIDGEVLTEEEILAFCQLLVLAGNETTRNAISGGLLAFIEHPGQWERLRADRALLPTAVEEILRWSSPLAHMMRTATRDVAIRDQQIKAGDRVILWYPSANRDEEAFPDPDRFDVGRTPNDHLAFGFGEHFCLGAGLARLEIRVMFDALLDRLTDIELTGPVERLRSTFLHGIKHMPIRFSEV